MNARKSGGPVAFRFEKLSVWRKAVDFAKMVYQVTADFPADERFGLTFQVRRAAVSISSNIAEGSSRKSNTDFARFVEISYGSLMEVYSQTILADELGYLSEENREALREQCDELARMLSGLRASLRTR